MAQGREPQPIIVVGSSKELRPRMIVSLLLTQTYGHATARGCLTTLNKKKVEEEKRRCLLRGWDSNKGANEQMKNKRRHKRLRDRESRSNDVGREREKREKKIK